MKINIAVIQKKIPVLPAGRWFEIISLTLFAIFWLLLACNITAFWSSLHGFWFWTALIFICFIAMVSADAASGLVHFLADNFGHSSMPILGKHFIVPFREHHRDCTAICTHDFIELNGNSAFCCLLVLIPSYFSLNSQFFLVQAYYSYLLIFTFNILMTNSIHRWAHLEKAPYGIRMLQKLHVILPSKHHNLHHTFPYNSHYCITNGWLNILANKIKFITKYRGKI